MTEVSTLHRYEGAAGVPQVALECEELCRVINNLIGRSDSPVVFIPYFSTPVSISCIVLVYAK